MEPHMNDSIFDFNKTLDGNSVISDYNMDGMAEKIKAKILSAIMNDRKGFLLVNTFIENDQVGHIRSYCEKLGKKLFILNLDNPSQCEFGINPFLEYSPSNVTQLFPTDLFSNPKDLEKFSNHLLMKTHEDNKPLTPDSLMDAIFSHFGISSLQKNRAVIIGWSHRIDTKIKSLIGSEFANALNCTDPDKNITLHQIIEKGHVLIVHGSNLKESRNFSNLLYFWAKDIALRQTATPKDSIQTAEKFYIIGDSNFKHSSSLTQITMPSNGTHKPKNIFGVFADNRRDITLLREISELQIYADFLFTAEKVLIQGEEGTSYMNIVQVRDRQGIHLTGIEQPVRRLDKTNGYFKLRLKDVVYTLNIQDQYLNDPTYSLNIQDQSQSFDNYDIADKLSILTFILDIITNEINTDCYYDETLVYGRIAAFQTFSAFLSYLESLDFYYTDKDDMELKVTISKDDFQLLNVGRGAEGSQYQVFKPNYP